MSVKWITQSLEELTHYQHEGCGWWSISEAPERASWFCPYCGKELELAPTSVSLIAVRKPTQSDIEYGQTLAQARILEIEREIKFLSERYTSGKLDRLLKPLLEEKAALEQKGRGDSFLLKPNA